MSDQPNRVLLVDDDPALLRLLALWLEKAGYEVERATDARQAMSAVQRQCPNVVVTDWEMPGMDGLEFCRWLRAQKLPNYIYTMILTVRCGSDDIIRGLEAGADDFLKKPVDRDELIARLQSGGRVVELEQRLRRTAKIDAVSGLDNRATFHERLEIEWQRSKRHRFPISCVMIDLDYFKKVNDTFGHQAGDEMIRAVARTLRESIRPSDCVCRYGGEEFCAILPETDEDQACLWAERVRRKIADLRIGLSEGREISITASFGAAQMPDDAEAATRIIEPIDQALLAAKQLGRDRVMSHSAMVTARNHPDRGDGVSRLFHHLTARHVMTAVTPSLRRGDSLGTAADFFLQFLVSSAPVIDDDGRTVGVLSERDVISVMLSVDWRRRSISDVMRKNLVCYEESTPAITIYEFLCRVSLKSVIIVRDGRPTGIVSRRSLLRWFANSSAVLEERSQGSDDDVELEGDVTSPRTRMRAAAKALILEARRLSQRLNETDVEFLPAVIGGATRVQERVNEIMTYSRILASQAWSSSHGENSSADIGITGLLAGISSPPCSTAEANG